MGISPGTLKLIPLTLKDKNLSGQVMTFGVQRVEGQAADIERAAQQVDYPLRKLAAQDVIYDTLAPQLHNRAHQDTLFKILGFNATHSIDFFPHENPTFVFDLNHTVPESLHGKYDLVYDGGTMEHCFNVPQVLANAVHLLKEGGMVIHHLPLNCQIDHGFYQFSPTLFFDFYFSNGFEDMEMKIHFLNPIEESYFTYDPRTDKALPFSFGHEEIYVFFSARKKAAQQFIAFPIQSRYHHAFTENKLKRQAEHLRAQSTIKTLFDRLLRKLVGDRYPDLKRKGHCLLDKRRMRRRVSNYKKHSIKV